MAKELLFKLVGSEYSAAPVKLERKKIYGWTSLVANNCQREKRMGRNTIDLSNGKPVLH